MSRDLEWLQGSTAAVVTRAAVAEVLHVDERTITRAIEADQLPSIRVGRRVLIPRLPLLDLLGAGAASGTGSGALRLVNAEVG